MMKIISPAVLAFSVLLLCLSQPCFAQDDLVVPQASRPAPAPTGDAGSQSLPPDDTEVTILRDEYAGKYNISTMENLSKLYWRLGAFDFDDSMAVANYIKINDCKIFTEYLNDDLEWNEIVKVMKDHLRKNSPAFPVDFQFVLQLHLGRYDPVEKGFPIVDNTGFIDAKRIEVVSSDDEKEICFSNTAIKDYPSGVVMILNKPFTLNFVKLDEHVAQAYILRKKGEYLKLDERSRVSAYERNAYLRLRVRFSQYHGNLRSISDKTLAILYADIDGYEVFEDANQKRLMLSVDMRDKNGAMSVPVQPKVETQVVPPTDVATPPETP